MDLALKDLGGTGGGPVRLVYEDNQGKSAVAVTTVQKLVDRDKVPVVVGSASSAVTMAMAKVANERKVVVFSAIASSPELSTKGGPFFFRVAPSDTAQAKIMADWLREAGLDRVAVLYLANTWGQSLFEAVKKDLEASGGAVVASEAIQEGQTDFRTQIEKFKSSGAQAFYVITHGKEGGTFVKQARQLKVEAPLFGADVWSSPEFLEVGGPSTEGCRYVAPAKLSGAEYDRFAARYKAAYGEEPDVYAAYSYDAVGILAAAARSGARTGEQLRSYLAKPKPFAGVSGVVTFDGNGDVVGRGFDRYQVRGGKAELLTQ